ncbi:MAG: UDP-N-acetylmuramoyl-L-alanyl-D-glutamate--2,6-diaminopimelate ligase [Deltaproteobacteria bacterium]|nr:MAG: UDP-N-acetylmuramoyl-L-alanyl-D-glutamate--2,6-diaminopimelate ligase [Deltaproteobacteria bacterium]
MHLAKLIHSLEVIESRGEMNLDIGGISYHSHSVKEGDLFVAIKGAKTDGHFFIKEAVKRGAKAIIVEQIPPHPLDITMVLVANTKKALAQISAEFFSHPSKEIKLVGITGTNGKTTTSYMIESILKKAGKEVGVMGTINYRFRGNELPAPTTTPQSYDLQRLLREMATNGAEYVVMEVSSHALDQERVRDCHFDAGVFTNLSPEHLDYHKNMDSYFAAKKRFFDEILCETDKDPWAILNLDDPFLRDLKKKPSALRVMSYGLKEGEVRLLRKEVSLKGIKATLFTPTGPIEIKTPLLGEYNLYNIMAATATAICLGTSPEAIQEGIAGLARIPGRMEVVGDGRPWVLVDYAHTPDALEKALKGVKKLIKGRLFVVFGCGGDRDRGKRPLMGRISMQWADMAIITSDNPRTEDPLEIINEIEKGAREISHHRYLVIPDRSKAISKAISMAGPQDLVLIAGKGHENYQIVGDKKLPFDDRKVAQRALKERRHEPAGE